MKNRIALSVLPVLCVLALQTSAFSAEAYDTPTVEHIRSGRTSITLKVVAGISGAVRGFTLEWLPASTYDALGGFPAEGDPRILKSSFYGTPTLNTEDGTSTYRLDPVDDASVQLGDLFDETGLSTAQQGELLEGTEYVVRVRANGDNMSAASQPSTVVRASTAVRSSQDCTYTQGYWKNHTSAWPVGSLKLGTVTYTAAQLLAIFNQPAKGNGLTSMAHQLIAAKLNVAQGATPPAAISLAIAQADALIGGLVAPPIGSGFLSPSSTSGLTTTLDNFNQGITGPGHCGSTLTKTPTWGELKTLYR